MLDSICHRTTINQLPAILKRLVGHCSEFLDTILETSEHSSHTSVHLPTSLKIAIFPNLKMQLSLVSLLAFLAFWHILLQMHANFKQNADK